MFLLPPPHHPATLALRGIQTSSPSDGRHVDSKGLTNSWSPQQIQLPSSFYRQDYKLWDVSEVRKEKSRGLLLQWDTNILPDFGNQPFCNTCLYSQGFLSCVLPLPYIGPWEMGWGPCSVGSKSLASYTNRIAPFQTDTSLVLIKQHRSLTQVDQLATSVVSGLTLPWVLDK